jgi:quercetin 2,3-dioxygenase
MNRYSLWSAILTIFIAALISYNLPVIRDQISSVKAFINNKITTAEITHVSSHSNSESTLEPTDIMAKQTLRHAKIAAHRSGSRGHADHGWLNTFHTFPFGQWHSGNSPTQFGALRVLNEDRVKAQSGFPTHPHSNFEIFSYIISGELTHRDSVVPKGKEGAQSNSFYRMRRGDVQFTTGGTGIAHSETNEHKSDTVHFLQIWVHPWTKGLTPQYHTKHFDDADKRKDFVTILSPRKAGIGASEAQEEAAEPAIPGSIPIHSDFVMGAGIIAPNSTFQWTVGSNATTQVKRKVYVHLPMTKNGAARIRLDGREDVELAEGDGAFVDVVAAGDKLSVESIGDAEAEVVILDTA